MSRFTKNITNNVISMKFWPIFGLFFLFCLIIGIPFIFKSANAAASDPVAAPPEENAGEYLTIDGMTQAKQGSLRLGTSNNAPPFNYQMEVLGEGAVSTEAVVEQNLMVGKTTSTFFVDATNNRVCVGPCLGITGSKLEIGGGTWSISTQNNNALSSASSSAEGLYGASVHPGSSAGVQGTSASDLGEGIRAESQKTTGAIGQSTAVFDKVLLAYGTSWYDRTVQASDATSNDVYTTAETNGMIYDGAIYFGLTSPFNRIYISIDPKTPTTGVVTWEYCSAANCTSSTGWSAINGTGTPYSGAYHFNANYPNPTTVVLWNGVPPSNFSKTNDNTLTGGALNDIDGLYYVRARVNGTTFPNPRPVGSQMVPVPMSTVYGYSQTGYGIYGGNATAYGLWDAYFDGRVEGSRDVSGAKLVRTALKDSLLPYTAGQEVDHFFRNYYPNRVASDGTYLYVGQKGSLVNGTWYGYEVLKVSKATGQVVQTFNLGFTSDMLFDGTYIWQAKGDYPGSIGRINVSTSIAERRSIPNLNPPDPYGDNIPNGNGTCPLGYIAKSGTTLWAVQPGNTNCFGYAYHDRLLRFDTTTYNNNPNTWTPNLQLEFDHVRQFPTSIIYDGTNLWVSFRDNNSVYKLNAITPDSNSDNILNAADYTVVNVPGPTDLVNDATNNVIWVSSDEAGTQNDGAYFINRSTNARSSLIPTTTGYSGGFGPWAIDYDGTNVWVGTNKNSNTGYADRFNAVNAIASPGTVSVSHFPTTIGRTENDILYDSSANAVWVVSHDSSNSIARLDPATGAVQSVFDYSLKNLSVKKFDGTYLWIANGTNIWKVRAEDGFVMWQKSFTAAPTEIYFDGNNAWASFSSSDQILKINPVTGDPRCAVPVPVGSHPSSVIFDGQYYWYLAAGTGDIVKFNGSTCAIVSTYDLTSAPDSLVKMAYDGSYLWALSPTENLVYTLNPSSGKAMAWLGLIASGVSDIVYDNYHFWTINTTNNTASRFYTRQNKVCSVPARQTCSSDNDCDAAGGCFPEAIAMKDNNSLGFGTGTGPTQAAFDGTYLWIINPGSDSLTRLNVGLPSDRVDYSLDDTPNGIVFDGTYLYVSYADIGLGKIYSGSGYGNTNMSRQLTLRSDNSSIPQEGSINISGFGRIGGTLTANYDFITTNNAWPSIGSGDVMINPDDTTWTQSGALSGATTVNCLIETSARTLMAGTNGGLVYRSTNNGATWSSVSIGVSNPVSVMTRVGTRLTLGVNVGFIPTIYTSTNDGVNWNSVQAFSGAYYVDALYASQNGYVYASTHGQMHSYHADIYQSVDGGASWNPSPVANISTTAYVTSFTEQASGVLFAGLTSGEIYRSIDNGVTWSLYTTLFPAENIKSMFRAGNGYLYAGTSVGGVFRSIDYGMTWSKIALPSTTEVRQFVQSGNSIYAVAAGGKVFSSTDNGGSWQLITTITSTPQLTSVILSSLGYLYTGTGTGLVYQSGLGVLGVGTKRCPAGHYITNITTNASGAVVRIDCRGL